jgi:hypothetical protein
MRRMDWDCEKQYCDHPPESTGAEIPALPWIEKDGGGLRRTEEDVRRGAVIIASMARGRNTDLTNLTLE